MRSERRGMERVKMGVKLEDVFLNIFGKGERNYITSEIKGGLWKKEKCWDEDWRDQEKHGGKGGGLW